MTVSTRIIRLDSQFQQLSDGESTVFIQVKSGILEYVVADCEPPESAEGHTACGKEFTITPPTIVWGRLTAGQICRIALTPF